MVGGVIGTLIGAVLFRLLQELGQIDTVINILYVFMLGSIGGLMARERCRSCARCAAAMRAPGAQAAPPPAGRQPAAALAVLPFGPVHLAARPAAARLATGILTMLMGIGGGFILVPAMLYILGMSASVVVGTSLFQILFVTMARR